MDLLSQPGLATILPPIEEAFWHFNVLRNELVNALARRHVLAHRSRLPLRVVLRLSTLTSLQLLFLQIELFGPTETIITQRLQVLLEFILGRLGHGVRGLIL